MILKWKFIILLGTVVCICITLAIVLPIVLTIPQILATTTTTTTTSSTTSSTTTITTSTGTTTCSMYTMTPNTSINGPNTFLSGTTLLICQTSCSDDPNCGGFSYRTASNFCTKFTFTVVNGNFNRPMATGTDLYLKNC